MIPDDEREMPPTRPDEEAASHKAICACDVCRRPGSMNWKQRAHKRNIRKMVGR